VAAVTGYGLDIGASKTLAVAIADDGRVLAQVRASTEAGPDGVLRTAEEVVHRLRDATGHGPTWPVGVGVPGLVDSGNGSVKHAVNLGLDGDWLPFGTRLAERLDHEVALENDVNAAALGAAAVCGVRDLALLSIGTGLAAGLVLDGRLRRGMHGAAGEIGHVPVDPTGLACPCGQRGCLETVASGSALAAAWPTAAGPPAKMLYAAAAAGDARAIDVRDRFAAAVAAAVRLLGLAVDTDAVVLGGGVTQVGRPLLDSVREALLRHARGSEFLSSLALDQRLRIVPADKPVAAIGAALLGRS
jgi:predicted NBD/HSP70 family sugar kinase